MLLAVLLRLLPPLRHDSLRVHQWNTGGLRARITELFHFLSSHPVDLICIQESNLYSSSSFRIPGFSALCSDLTHSRSGILSRDATHASSGVIIFVRKGLSFSEFSTFSLFSLDPYSDYTGINISLNNSSSLSFLNVYAPPFAPPRRMAEPTPFLPPPEISSFWRNLIAITPLGLKRYFCPRGEEVFDWVISSYLPLNDPDTPILLYCSFPDISFAPSSLVFSCSREVLHDLGSDHLPILLSVPLSSVFCSNKHPPSFNFQKARWDDFAFYLDSHCPSAEEYSSLSLSSAAALFFFLTLNAAKSSIPFGRIKRHPKAWWSAEVEGAVKEKRTARLRHGRRLALLFHPNLTLTLYTLSLILSLALLPRLPPLLTSPTVLLPANRLRSMLLTCDPTFPFLSQRPCVAEPEATSLSSAEPRALRCLTRPFALLSLPLNFLRLSPTSPRPLPLVQTKLPIPC